MGQELALRQATDAICDHLAQPEPIRPLVLSVHGPPGVGKSLSHLMAARALYNRHIHPDLRCPGYDCAGYKVRCGGSGMRPVPLLAAAASGWLLTPSSAPSSVVRSYSPACGVWLSVHMPYTPQYQALRV